MQSQAAHPFKLSQNNLGSMMPVHSISTVKRGGKFKTHYSSRQRVLCFALKMCSFSKYETRRQSENYQSELFALGAYKFPDFSLTYVLQFGSLFVFAVAQACRSLFKKKSSSKIAI